MKKEGKPNSLIKESSPYLLQHAHNPVDWHPWRDEVLDAAFREDKPIFLSIGYSACHWCHVMERESFENPEIAEFLNDHFISIKVDREERPDIDQVYMDAVQAMGIQGGWPLNVFLTPEQKPFFGGTYFPPQSFIEIIRNISTAYKTRKEKLNLSAENLANHLSQSEIKKFGLSDSGQVMDTTDLQAGIGSVTKKFDFEFGGMQRAPKFPMPSLWKFLLRYGHYQKNHELTGHVLFTLKKIGRGGIYDHIGGGFARYSVDEQWFAPHFEKMLYDNGQLLSLYSEAYQFSSDEEFAEKVRETVRFIDRELRDTEGGFYSALDADSEGVEGKFYVWDWNEFTDALDDEANIWPEYFGMTKEGNWEHGMNILTANNSLKAIATELNIPLEEAGKRLSRVKSTLLDKRSGRVRPGLDNKILAGWNGIALIGLIDAYAILQDHQILDMAIGNGEYLLKNHLRKGRLYRTSLNHASPIPGYLEDYAFVIQAFIRLYEVTFNESWLFHSREMMDYAIDHFYDPKEGFFYVSDNSTPQLIAAKKEIFDNVIPSSNSVMAEDLLLLGLFFEESQFTEMAERMVRTISPILSKEPEYSSYWGLVFLRTTRPMAEIAIIGKDAHLIRNKLNRTYYPNKLFCGAEVSSDLPLLKGRMNTNDNTLYVCYDKTCKLPVHSVEEAVRLLA